MRAHNIFHHNKCTTVQRRALPAIKTVAIQRRDQHAISCDLQAISRRSQLPTASHKLELDALSTIFFTILVDWITAVAFTVILDRGVFWSAEFIHC